MGEELRKLVYTKNTTTLLQDGLKKVLQNITTIEEILRLVELDDESVKIVTNNNSGSQQIQTKSNDGIQTNNSNSDAEMLDI